MSVINRKPVPRLLLWLPPLLGMVLALLYWRGLSYDPNQTPARLIGKPLPGFQLPALSGGIKQGAGDIQGPALLNVWATWCAACRAEHPLLLNLSRQRSITIYGINYQDDAALARDWLRNQGDPFVWTVFDGAASLGGALDVLGLPQSYLIDAHGIVRYRHVGELTEAVWQTMRQILQESDTGNKGFDLN